jgi:hypothetical protein
MTRAKTYTPRTVLATPVATLGDPLAKPPRKNARKCPPDEDYSVPHPSAAAHDVCAPATLPALPNKPWVLTKEAETGKVTIRRRAPAAAPYKARAKPADPAPLADHSFDDTVPLLPGPSYGQVGQIAMAGAMLARMRAGQSKQLPLNLKSSLQKAVAIINKTAQARYAVRCKFDAADTLRVWRVA